MEVGKLYRWKQEQKHLGYVSKHWVWPTLEDFELNRQEDSYRLEAGGLVMILEAGDRGPDKKYKVLTTNGNIGWIIVATEFLGNWNPATV
jgi:hypothetical protein